MTHISFHRCSKCGEELHIIDNKEVGHFFKCEDYEKES